ncbi:MAG: dTDP-4-dehydrorhamnose 3,5-epimerase [Candidatus Acididesulfobacter guangdongensis]|uniref:dTDP-4-dehydrorhamnose 3,5-epimerase n=1 Tax=Acididesulfobacter guangdongensis TaxID=2597225 RepID=A0A519BFF9_ACIG2|nr:MAG: dTDP-4-dehydrorhamnose 3,5-epimerase [Candidatus Acididesulfobacter guangdongensis]
MNNFIYTATKLKGLYLITPKPKTDSRGYFERLYCIEEFKEVGLKKPLCNINRSFTKQKGTIRGLHFQHPPFQEVKIIICLKGIIYDVAVDIRKNSPTFLQWHSEILDSKSRKIFLIPEGFAHGFQAMENDVELLYLHTNFYNKEYESGINCKDPMLNIQWPLNVTQVSERDKNHKFISHDFKGVDL